MTSRTGADPSFNRHIKVAFAGILTGIAQPARPASASDVDFKLPVSLPVVAAESFGLAVGRLDGTVQAEITAGRYFVISVTIGRDGKMVKLESHGALANLWG